VNPTPGYRPTDGSLAPSPDDADGAEIPDQKSEEQAALYRRLAAGLKDALRQAALAEQACALLQAQPGHNPETVRLEVLQTQRLKVAALQQAVYRLCREGIEGQSEAFVAAVKKAGLLKAVHARPLQYELGRSAIETGSLPNLRRVIQSFPHLLTYSEPTEGDTLAHEAARHDRVRMLAYLHAQEPLAVELANKRGHLPAYTASAHFSRRCLEYLMHHALRTFQTKDRETGQGPFDLQGGPWVMRKIVEVNVEKAVQISLSKQNGFSRQIQDVNARRDREAPGRGPQPAACGAAAAAGEGRPGPDVTF
jgi:hypothetical protein